MSEKHFRLTTNPKSNAVAFDEKQKKHYIGIALEDLLNEQQAMINELKTYNREQQSIITKLNNQIEQLNLAIDDLLTYMSCDEIKKQNEQSQRELDSFKPVMFQDMRKGTIILYSKGDTDE